MKTSHKVLIVAGSVAVLYIAWELFWALRNSEAAAGTGSTTSDDYDAYIAGITGNSTGSEKNETKSSSLGSWLGKLLGNATTMVPVSGSSDSTTPATKTGFATSCFPLKYGTRNEAVKQLQVWLNRFLSINIKTDGVYGNETNNALSQLYTRVNALGSSVKVSSIMTKTGDRFTISEDQFAAMKGVMKFY